MNRHGHRRSGIDTGELLDRERVREIVRSSAAVLFGHENSHDAGARQLSIKLAGKNVVPIPLRDEGRDLALRDLRRERSDLALLVA
jgi:hypothetical protein